MTTESSLAPTFTAFRGTSKVAAGDLKTVLLALKAQENEPQTELTLLFDDQTGRLTDFNLRGTPEQVAARAEQVMNPPARTGRGRPKLGVTAKEVTLLPRHWEWLEAQSGGASATLRRLVDEARKRDPGGEQLRLAQAATDRFLGVMAGDLAGYEEATRALYRRDHAAFEERLKLWPQDIRDHAKQLSQAVFEGN